MALVPQLVVTAARVASRLARLAKRGERALDRHFVDAPAAVDDTVLDWYVSELTLFRGRVLIRGWADTTAPVVRVHIATARDTVKAVADVGVDGKRTHFSATFAEVWTELARTPSVRLVFADGRVAVLDNIARPAIADDEYHRLHRDFFEAVSAHGSECGGQCLEIGSRNRSGEVRRDWVGPMAYVGVDIVAGENVDVVCDAHELSEHLPHDSFDAAFSISTFEHLAMPWKVVIELNRVLKTGGRALIASHQSYPLHDAPWDFWRFSTSAWKSLFNAGTGFRVVEAAYGEPASVASTIAHGTTDEIELKPAWLGSAVIVEKVGPTTLSWDVDPHDVAPGDYPA